MCMEINQIWTEHSLYASPLRKCATLSVSPIAWPPPPPFYRRTFRQNTWNDHCILIFTYQNWTEIIAIWHGHVPSVWPSNYHEQHWFPHLVWAAHTIFDTLAPPPQSRLLQNMHKSCQSHTFPLQNKRSTPCDTHKSQNSTQLDK